TANLIFNQVVPFERARFTCTPGAALTAESFGRTIFSENDSIGRSIPPNQRPACPLTLTPPCFGGFDMRLGRRLTRTLALVGAIPPLLAVGLPGAPAAKVKPVPWPFARYVVTQGADQIIGDVTPKPAFLAVQSGTVVLGSCNMSGPAPKAKKSGVTTLSAKAATCGTFSKVKLKAKMPKDCQTLSGTVKAKKLKPQPFQAKISTCGDGVIDTAGGEAC